MIYKRHFVCDITIDDHRGQIIVDVISNSDHITLDTNTPTRVPNTTIQQTSSDYCKPNIPLKAMSESFAWQYFFKERR